VNLLELCPHCGLSVHAMTHDAPCLRAAYRLALKDGQDKASKEIPAEALTVGFVLSGLEFALRKVEAQEKKEAQDAEEAITKVP